MKLKSLILLFIIFICANNCWNRKFLEENSDFGGPLLNPPKIPRIDSLCIVNKEFKVGMRMETVRFLIGEPKEIIVDNATEKWVYKRREVRKVFGVETLIFGDNGTVIQIIPSRYKVD